MMFGTDNPSLQRMEPKDFDNILTFHPMLAEDQSFQLSSEISKHVIHRLAQIFGKHNYVHQKLIVVTLTTL